MNRSVVGSVIVSESSGDIMLPAKRNDRHKLVQSILFPQVSPDGEIEGENACDNDSCGWKDAKSVGRRQKKKWVTTTPTKSSKKYHNSSGCTPKKNSKEKDEKSAHCIGVKSTELSFPNLRLEAKHFEEENSRSSVGRKIHPFFLSKMTGKGCNEEKQKARGCCSSWVEERMPYGPIHIFEDDLIIESTSAVNWHGWKFSEDLYATYGSSSEASFSSLFHGHIKEEGYLKSPQTTDYPSAPCTQDRTSFAEITSSKFSICQSNCICDAQEFAIVDRRYFSSPCEKESMSVRDSKLYQERLMSCGGNPFCEHRMWTEKYQPIKAFELCGNSVPVAFLNDWLHAWHIRIGAANKDDSCLLHCIQDTDECSGTNSDSENNLNDSLKNVLLIIGPVGSGKSAAVYACAMEQGFKVLEINASECRSATVVKQRFGESLETQVLERFQGSHLGWREDAEKSQIRIPHRKLEDFTNINKARLVSSENDCHGLGGNKSAKQDEGSPAYAGHHCMSLILFEDIDITLPEDHGFIPAMQQIVDKSKCPVILTCNRRITLLPDQFGKIEVFFSSPTHKELLDHALTICSLENLSVHPHAVETVVEFCKRDLRKTITALQFWFQGCMDEVPRVPCLTTFCLEDGHHFFSKLIPWGLPSQLSEYIYSEMRMFLSPVNTNPNYDINEQRNKGNGTNFSQAFNFLDSKVSVPEKGRKRKFVFVSDDSDNENLDAKKLHSSEDTIDIQDRSHDSFPDLLASQELDTFHQSFETRSDFCFNKFDAVNNSYVSETTVVPETEFTVSQVSMQNDNNDCTTASYQDCVQSHEEAEDLQGEDGESYVAGYQVMDECSRMCFKKNLNPHVISEEVKGANLVQAFWRKLHGRHMDLSSLVGMEHKFASDILELTCGLANLISEAEIMFCSGTQLSEHQESTMEFNWFEEHKQLASSIFERGFHLFAKDAAAMKLKMDNDPTSDSISQTSHAPNPLITACTAQSHTDHDSPVLGLRSDPYKNGVPWREERTLILSK